MTYLYRSVLTLIFTSLILHSAFAQNENEVLISGDFTSKRLPQIFQEIEQKTSYKFYYNPAAIDSVQIGIVVTEKSVPEILTMLFNNTDLHFTIDASKHVYVIQGREIQASLPEDFFDRESRGEGKYNKALLDYLEKEKKQKSKMMAESKLYD